MDKQEPEQELELKFQFNKSEEHKKFFTNKVWGGVQNGQTFELNFLLEHKPIPESVTEKISGKGTREIEREQTDTVTRENQATAYMSLATMLSMYEWLGQKIEELEEEGIITHGEPEEEDLSGE